jgi:hypothetical protein
MVFALACFNTAAPICSTENRFRFMEKLRLRRILPELTLRVY